MRSWLEQHKVFFEVAAAILIGGASLIVAYSALRVSERTLAATEVSALPHFALSKRARIDSVAGKYIEETLVLNNHGAPVSNITWDVRTFLVFDRYRPSPGRSYIPIVGYYFAQLPTASPTGELASIVGHENMRKFGAMYQDALDHKVQDPDYSAFPSVLTVSFVGYEDRLGRVATTYFRDYTRVSEEDVKPLLELAGKTRGLDIDNVTLAEALRAAQSAEALNLPLQK